MVEMRSTRCGDVTGVSSHLRLEGAVLLLGRRHSLLVRQNLQSQPIRISHVMLPKYSTQYEKVCRHGVVTELILRMRATLAIR